MAAALGRKKVGESVWMLWRCLYSGVGEEGRKCDASFESREEAPDMMVTQMIILHRTVTPMNACNNTKYTAHQNSDDNNGPAITII